MPGFISHTVMARDVCNRIKNDNSLKYMMTFSLGGDLSKYSKCRYVSHHKDMDKFIYNMADYIRNNKLGDNKALVGVLYAHICHYMMDDTLHPLVRSASKKSVKNKRNHALIELYYDRYLVNNIDIYIRNRILSARFNNDISKMIDYAYMKTYGVRGISRYYKFNLRLYRLLLFIYRLFGSKFIYKVLGVNKYLRVNKDIDLVNNINELYDDSISRSVEYIKRIDEYLTNE